MLIPNLKKLNVASFTNVGIFCISVEVWSQLSTEETSCF